MILAVKSPWVRERWPIERASGVQNNNPTHPGCSANSQLQESSAAARCSESRGQGLAGGGSAEGSAGCVVAPLRARSGPSRALDEPGAQLGHGLRVSPGARQSSPPQGPGCAPRPGLPASLTGLRAPPPSAGSFLFPHLPLSPATSTATSDSSHQGYPGRAEMAPCGPRLPASDLGETWGHSW